MTYAIIKSVSVALLGIISLAIFVWVIWPSNKAKFEKHSRIPLQEDEVKEKKEAKSNE